MKVMPCQCGAKHAPTIHERIREHAGHYPSAWHVYCEVCGLRAPTKYSREDAIRSWNHLALAVQITEAAWLGRETMSAAQSCRQGSSVNPLGATLELAARDLAQKMGRLLDQWEEEFE